MRKQVIKSFERVIVLLLVIMGAFSSCKKEDPKPNYGDNVQRYGCPEARYYNGTMDSVTDVFETYDIDNQDNKEVRK